MATLKYSRQRESIKNYLLHTEEHPTADTVYMHVREEFPNISLGTVYRNLNLLAETGDALKIPTPSGGDRFDGKTTPHYHFICTCCGKVMDLDMERLYFKVLAKEFFKYPLTKETNYAKLISVTITDIEK